MRERGAGADVSPSSSSLIALKPRQVLLAQQQKESRTKLNSMAKKQPEDKAQLKPKQKSILLNSIALCLQKNGFSKSLKRFMSEAQIEGDEWNTNSVDLEDFFSKFLYTYNDIQAKSNPQNDKEKHVNSTLAQIDNSNYGPSEESVCKKKKKKKSEDKDNVTAIYSEKHSDDKINGSHVKSKAEKDQKAAGAALDQSDPTLESSKDASYDKIDELPRDEFNTKKQEKKRKKSNSMSELGPESLDVSEKKLNVLPDASEEKHMTKDKRKKNKRKKDGLSIDGEEGGAGSITNLQNNDVAGAIPLEQNKGKSKDKKKKKEAAASEELSGSGAKDLDKEKLTDSNVEANGDKKASKKRKRLPTDINENQPIEEVAVEELKRRKTEGLAETKVVVQQAIDGVEPLNPAKQFSESTNDDLSKNEVEKSSQPASSRKQRNGSAEPTTVRAFRRVKVEEVKFVDKRLEDNSYWAKDGAESGYGAKAQEVLGQVRGRDFRHEKTKKKRGNYRGGLVDLHCHSVKFNYSDEE